MNMSLIGCGVRLLKAGPYFYHPHNPLTFYLVAHLPWLVQGQGMFITKDGGDNYSFMYELYGMKPVVAVSRSNPEAIYASGVMGNIRESFSRSQ